MVRCDRCGAEFYRTARSITASNALHGQDLCKRCVTIGYNQTRPMSVRKKAGAAAAKKCLGKKLEDIVGDERATKIRQTLSAQRTGAKNHNFGGAHQKFPVRTGTLVQQFGEEKAAQIRKKLSDASRGEKNGMFGIPTPKRAGAGISGHYKSNYFRSLLELSYIIHLENAGIEFLSCDGRKDFKFQYCTGDVNRTYFPDFYIPSDNTIVEVKPARLIQSEVNILKADAVKKTGVLFKFVTEDDVPRIDKATLLKLIKGGEVTIDENKVKLLHL